MATKTAVAAPVPEAFYREVIDLNRYSNSVAGQYARAYNDIIARAAERLVDIDFRQQGVINAVAPETRKRLRAIIKQSKDSLNTWSGESARAFKKELQGLAVLQTEFIEDELKKVVASGDIPINSVAVSTGFGDAVVSTDPTRLNLFGRPEEEFKKFKAGDFALSTRRGELLTLPNGETVEKAFRGIAARSSERLGGAIRQGVLSGETNVQIARRLMGRLNFNEYAKEGTRAFALAGNQPLKLANNQIKTIVRTSINQVSNAASQSVYAANKDVAPEYEYVATLDSRTSSICQRLDGQKFGYDKGPTPPQHFNCRSTTVPVVDYEGLGLTPPPETKITTRPSETGRVPQKVSYGDWLYEQRARGANDKLLKYEPGELQIKTLGFEKAKYFNRLAAKSNGKDALRQVIRSDGTELTLEQLKKKYGKPSDIKAAKKATPKATPKVKTAAEELKETKAQLAALRERDPSLPTIAQLQVVAPTAKLKAQDIQKTFDLMDEMEGLAGENARKLRQFQERKGVASVWSTGREAAVSRAKSEKGMAFILDNPYLKEATRKADKTIFGKEYREIYEDRLRTGFPSYQAKSYFTMYKQSKGVKGFTFREGSNHVVVRRESKTIGITKKNQLAEVRKSVEDVITKRGGYFELNRSAGGDLRFTKPELDWLTTYIHEMGHQVHFVTKELSYEKFFEGVEKVWKPSVYGGSDNIERFAETFVQYVLAPDSLKKTSPEAYEWVDTVMAQALEAL